MPKISALNEITNPAPDDILAGVDDSAETTKYIKIGTLLNLLYPVGSQYVNYTDETSPATLFGIGTWQRIQGRTIVGISDTDPDFAEGSTGGQKNVQAHSHGINDPGHAHGVYDPGHSHSSANGQNNAIQVASSTNTLVTNGNAAKITWGNTQTSNNGSNIGIYGSGTGVSVQNTGSGANNMNPYATAYIWQRIA